MKTIPPITESFKPLFNLLMGPVHMRLLMTGIELGIFDHLSQPATAGEVAPLIDAHPQNLKLFLNALTAMGLLEKDGETYNNRPTSQAFLTRGRDTYLGGMFEALVQMQHQPLENLTDIVRNGPPPKPPAANLGLEGKWARATEYLANYQRAGMAQDAVRIISALPEFPGFKKMLDLGGGPGIIGIALVAAHPDMTGVLFDLPGVAEAAKQHIRAYRLEDRMTVLGGNYNTDSIGSGYDLIWASLNLYYARQDLDAVMSKIHDALNPGGVFVSFHEGLENGRTCPEISVITRLATALMDQDVSFDKGQIAGSLHHAGFKSIHSMPFESPVGLMEMDIARKGTGAG